MITANPFLWGLRNGSDKPFKPQQILDAFDMQLARREAFENQHICFAPPPEVEQAKVIVAESKARLTAILEARKLSPDEIVQDTEARKELVAFVRAHLEKFYY